GGGGRAGGWGGGVGAGPGRSPLSRRFNERAWIRLDGALAVVCGILIYGTMLGGQAVYVFPLGIWADAWVPPLLAIALALPVALRRKDPVGALVLALAGCSVVVAVGAEVNRGPFLPLALGRFPW